ncbi:Phosphate ABC transporter, phosphate-binding protein PstS [Rubrobacter radiotolerans]|uniref:Phosphate-binding protein n=1 Tax=Rubrobacter radiotolerans TaxID=42256 RepID=A0A023X1Q4_RUBRA|nr:phosphate ABC transporter substrate-binding protein PstS [Rubrobacter radiotolerans]AHY45984.1 Phosphate ABC transporter, phosphate-binding protein PstS [Rubrobacter radiotolerans]MDX5893396.1 phosphate ABC transporter substrate-binding protein PstS [Rubrobacter radiotolerans]SMC03652.1 phosphate ABC transporter substrate-binding protein, PhoT family [Rubrobacter radiotolerans DSM 5868]
MSKFARWKMLGAGLAFSALLVGCATAEETGTSGGGGGEGGDSGGGGTEPAQSIDAAGASFPAPLYSQILQQFAEAEGIQVNYQSIGSSGGREQFIQQNVSFGASDEPMDDEEMEQAGGEPVHIATVGGAVVPAYNLEGVEQLNFTGEVLAEIFLGNITNWNDPAIAELNPDADLPDAEITVVHRSDGSGTTNIWTSYLSAVSEEWANGPGPGGEVSWPTGVGGDGNEGVAGQIQQTPNSLGYVGLEYAVANDISYGSVGEEGNFVEPSVDSAQAALDAVADEIPDDLRVTVSELEPTGEGVYPITGLTWILVRQQMDDLAECKAVAETAWYMTHEGQELAPEQNYVPVSDDINATNEEFIRGMEAEGEPCYEG